MLPRCLLSQSENLNLPLVRLLFSTRLLLASTSFPVRATRDQAGTQGTAVPDPVPYSSAISRTSECFLKRPWGNGTGRGRLQLLLGLIQLLPAPGIPERMRLGPAGTDWEHSFFGFHPYSPAALSLSLYPLHIHTTCTYMPLHMHSSQTDCF